MTVLGPGSGTEKGPHELSSVYYFYSYYHYGQPRSRNHEVSVIIQIPEGSPVPATRHPLSSFKKESREGVKKSWAEAAVRSRSHQQFYPKRL